MCITQTHTQRHKLSDDENEEEEADDTHQLPQSESNLI